MRALTGTALGLAALLLAALLVALALDRTRQGRDLSAEVYTAGVAGWIALAVLLVLVARAHRLAAPYAAPVAVAFAAGFLAGLGAPHWSALSDPSSAWDPDEPLG